MAMTIAICSVGQAGCSSDSATPAPRPGVYRVAVLPDTQCYSLYYPDIFRAQGDFVFDNAARLDIRAAVHLGDITENNVLEQWDVAEAALLPLYEVMPLGLAPGNHDLGMGGTGADRSTMLASHFPVSTMTVAPGFVEAFEDSPGNTAWTFSGIDRDYILVALEFAPRAAVRSWAREVLARFADHIGIVSTHAYLDRDGSRYDHLSPVMQQFCPYEYGVALTDAGDGEELFQEVISPSPNVRLVLSGHVPNGFAYSVDTNQSGIEVHQLMTDYQTGTVCPQTGGDGRGYMLLLEFDERPSGVFVGVQSYSPSEAAFREDHELQFTLAPL